ncbi:hypothetical protein MKX01_023946 [Papaver californicum]|nr:hypothetical protein MKX01_023946 [Papaver californicum]
MVPTVFVECSEQKDLKKRVSVEMMGKAQRTSRGSSTGFVADNRHVVETMGESKGLGSSGRLDTERTASDDSCAPKRKCISLNVDSFGVPMQVISLSKFSAIEKKELETRLKAELEQIQMLQKKLYMLPRSDRMTRQGNVLGSSDILAGQGKKRGPSGKNGHSTKRGNHGKFQNKKHVSTASSSNSKLMKQCEQLLKRLMTHPYGWVFNTPVDIVQLNIPDYFTHIKHPMDLGTVKSKIAKGEYPSPLGFLADVRLTFSNAMMYNPPGHDVHTMAGQLRTFFEARWKAIEKKLPANESVPVPLQLDAARDTVAAKSIPPSKKMKISSPGHERIMTDMEKLKLTEDLQSIRDFPPNLIEFLRKQSTSQTADDELELDIENMTGDTLFTLRKLVDDYMQDQQGNQRKAVPCITENMNVSGNGVSSMQPSKGNDPVDDDVDIGGNDPPASIYPPMEIDKDAAHKSSKCSSSGGSSSDSGSSSSGLCLDLSFFFSVLKLSNGSS